jgi:hypothetical protein
MRFSGAGALGVLTMAFIAAYKWGEEEKVSQTFKIFKNCFSMLENPPSEGSWEGRERERAGVTWRRNPVGLLETTLNTELYVPKSYL